MQKEKIENFCKCGRFNYAKNSKVLRFPRGVTVEYNKKLKTFTVKCKCGEEIVLKTE